MRNMGVSLGMIACACLCSAGSSSADVVTDWNARAGQAVGAATGAAARLSGTGFRRRKQLTASTLLGAGAGALRIRCGELVVAVVST